MASSITIKTDYGYGTYTGRYLELTCEQIGTDIATNTSTVKWTLSSVGGSVNYYDTGPTTVIVNGTTVYSKARTFYINQEPREYYNEFPTKRGSVSGEISVAHTTDGSKTISVSVSTVVYEAPYLAQTYSGDWTLDSIPRGATLLSAQDFNTNSWSPQITYSNPAGASMDICISLDNGTTATIPYRSVGSATSGTYTFSLTSSDQNILKSATANLSSIPVLFVLRTTIGGQYHYSTTNGNKTFTVRSQDAAPTVNPSITVDSTTLSLTGSQNTFIANFTDLSVSAGASANWGASISSYRIKCGSSTITSSSGTFTDVRSSSVSVSVTDSRNFTTTVTPTKYLVNYIPLTITLGSSIDGSGVATLQISGKCFTGSFGAVSNTLTVQYRMKTGSGSYGSWTNVSVSPSSNQYSATQQISGLTYTNTYTFQVRATDRIGTVTSDEQTKTGSPVFQWNKTEFDFNVPVKFNSSATITVNRGGTTNNQNLISASGPMSGSGSAYICLGGNESDSTVDRFYIGIDEDGTFFSGYQAAGAAKINWRYVKPEW